VLADPVFRKNADGLVETSRQAAQEPAWFQQNHAETPLTYAAYFSMEFMLSEALPIYSGGLGNVAAINLRPPAIWVYRWSAWGSSTAGLLSPGDRQERRATGALSV